MARIPDTFIENKLSDLKIGEACYVVPWAMWVRSDGRCFLDESRTFELYPRGTVQLRIKRVKSGYIAYIFEMKDSYNFKWSKEEKPDNQKPIELCYGKVVGFGKNSKYTSRGFIDLSKQASLNLEEAKRRLTDPFDVWCFNHIQSQIKFKKKVKKTLTLMKKYICQLFGLK